MKPKIVKICYMCRRLKPVAISIGKPKVKIGSEWVDVGMGAWSHVCKRCLLKSVPKQFRHLFK